MQPKIIFKVYLGHDIYGSLPRFPKINRIFIWINTLQRGVIYHHGSSTAHYYFIENMPKIPWVTELHWNCSALIPKYILGLQLLHTWPIPTKYIYIIYIYMYIYIIVEKSPNSSHMYDHGFMDNTNRQAVKNDLIHRQDMRPFRHGASHFVNGMSLDFFQQL